MKSFKILTLGCKVNQAESEAIAQCLETADLNPAPEGQAADLCIINTCTVTQKASMQSRQAIRRAIRSNPKAKIIVTGCYAQTAPEEIKEISGIQQIISQADKYKLPEIITKGAACEITGSVSDGPKRLFDSFPLPGYGKRTRPFLKVQDGCNAFCTYCIVPYARGPSRSLPLEDVLTNIRKLSEAGYREVVLAGIHLGCYGLDLSPKTNLLELLQHIRDSKTIEQIRLSSIEPQELNGNIIDFVAQSSPAPGSVCQHFHIPLKSGDDEILKRMKRPYTGKFFRELIMKIHRVLPDAASGVDILVGFPGESEAAFDTTYALIEALPISYLHVFPFSGRKGTPAYTFDDKIPPQVIKDRCRKMRNLGSLKKKNFYRRFLGKSLKTLIEAATDKKTGLVKGRTTNYIPVLVAGEKVPANTLVEVRIDKVADDNSVFGTVCHP
ncbi:MAG: tRNA (N(6)-L-threonylcarbamoyladenosine(37)-C(2))-methylthiotransferase MtaB [Deltaproteobacteria bacterium]|nr:MAG: tRNA (N(6)-L-threonylcarbamoyladenosine(37)-C(2))-methylthiotransferase MtaB [Deltaproteobacteria bacterium]